MIRELNQFGEAAEVVRDKQGRFVKGLGRTKGVRSALPEVFLSDLLDHWNEHGIEAIERVCKRRPDRYLQIIVALLPKIVNLNVSKPDDASNEELLQRLRGQLAELARAGVDLIGEGDAVGAARPALELHALSEAKAFP